MTTKEIKEYLNNTTFFKLKDEESTSSKYRDYKNNKFNEWLKEYNKNTSIWDFESMFSYSFNPYRNQLQETKNNPTKRNIRFLATEINYIMREDIEKYIDWIFDSELNDNEKRSFTIKYYLKYYTKINKAMTNILKESVID